VTKRRVIPCLLLIAALSAVPLGAYLKLGVTVGGRLIELRWDRPVEYFVTNRDATGVTAPQLQTAVDRAFANWTGLPSTTAAYRFVGFTDAEPATGDNLSTIGFRYRPELDRTLAATTFDLDEVTGRVLASDIFFNTAADWSAAPAGEAGRFDVESVAVHEVGHLYGIGHSALGETQMLPGGNRRVVAKRAAMFPIAYPAGTVQGRQLDADDRAAFADVYGTASADARTGAIAGRVIKAGRGVFGAHVTATNTRTGDIIGGFSLNASGNFVISGLAAGLYIVRVEPLDDADIGGFFDLDAGVDVDFVPSFHPGLVAVPRGGAGPTIALRVTGK
jgi:hypothetical protein